MFPESDKTLHVAYLSAKSAAALDAASGDLIVGNDDNGQGDRPIPPFTSPNIIRSYPMQMHSPEFRVAIKLTRNIDWNFGYQYFKYEDVFTPAQNYNAHLPYTSLRIHWGGESGTK